ncbi:MAG: hypothetical protein R3B70_40035 [Polyangiaceae bacterium]
MNYRDDREVLRERVRALEGEIEAARREGEQDGREAAQQRVQEMEGRLAAMRGEVERMEGELRAMRGPQPEKKPDFFGAPPMRRLALLVVVAGVAGGLATVLRERPEPTHVPLPPSLDEPSEPADGPNVQKPPPPPPPVPSPKRPKKAEAPKPERRTTKVRWKATVTRAEGVAVAGKPCFIDATIATSETNAGVPALTVTCGDRKLYDDSESFNGMAQMDNDARERLGASDDKSTFVLQYSDVGARSGRAQVQIDTEQKLAEVWSDNLPRFRVQLRVPVESEPAEPLARGGQRMRFAGFVAEVSGAAPVKADAECVLRAMPTGRQDECEAELACGKIVLFPRTEPVTCDYEGARPVKVTASGGAIELSMDGVSARVRATKPKAFEVRVHAGIDEP